MLSTEIKEVCRPPERKLENQVRDMVRDGEQKLDKKIDSLENEVDLLVDLVVYRAKSSVSTHGVAHETVLQDQGRIEKAGEVWKGILKKKVTSKAGRLANPFEDDQREITSQVCNETLQATLDYYGSLLRSITHPMANLSQKTDAVQRLSDAYQELKREEESLTKRYRDLSSTASYKMMDSSQIGQYIEEKIKALRTLQTELNSSTEQRDHIGVREDIKTKVDQDVRFWEAARTLHEIISGEYRKTEKDTTHFLEDIATQKHTYALRRVKNSLRKMGIGDDIISSVDIDKERAIHAIEANVRERYPKIGDQDQETLLKMASKTRRVIEGGFVDPDYHNEMNDTEKMRFMRYKESLGMVKNSLRKMGIGDDIISSVEIDKERAIHAIEASVRERYPKIGDQDQETLLKMASKIRRVIEGGFVDLDHPYSVYNRQHELLLAARHSCHEIIAKIQDKASEATELTEDANKKEFVHEMKQVSTQLEAAIFKELVERHAARRSGQNIPSWYFLAPTWHYDPTRQKDNPQYRDIDVPHLDGPCVSVCLTRIVSQYLPQIASSPEELLKRVEEIYQLDRAGSKRNFSMHASNGDANYLNTELEGGRLNIPMPEGKKVRYKVVRGSGYVDLDKYMNIKDEKGDYIPIIVVVAYDPDENDADHINGHQIVLHKQGDLYDAQGNHYPDFVVYNPYIVVKPANKYALDDILERSYMQSKNGRNYIPGYMGDWRIVVPEEVAVDKKSTGLNSRAIASRLLREM